MKLTYRNCPEYTDSMATTYQRVHMIEKSALARAALVCAAFAYVSRREEMEETIYSLSENVADEPRLSGSYFIDSEG
jgi:hypothetical protein